MIFIVCVLGGGGEGAKDYGRYSRRVTNFSNQLWNLVTPFMNYHMK